MQSISQSTSNQSSYDKRAYAIEVPASLLPEDLTRPLNRVMQDVGITIADNLVAQTKSGKQAAERASQTQREPEGEGSERAMG